MRRLFLVSLIATLIEAQSFVKGFDFRDTSGFATDPTNCTYVLSTDNYTGSVIRNGVAFGWTTSISGNSRDRDASGDQRLAGINFSSSAVSFRVDLPGPGTYNVAVALGDMSFQETGQTLVVKDNATTLTTIGGNVTTGGGHFLDATNTDRTSITWVSTGATAFYVATYATSTAIFTMGGGGGGNSSIAHILISGSPSGGGGGGTIRRRMIGALLLWWPQSGRDWLSRWWST